MAKKKFFKISADAFQTMQFNAGRVLNKFDIEGSTPVADADEVCATSGGVTAICKANVIDMGEDVDNCPKNTVELMEIESYDCSLAFDALNINAETFKLAVGAADVSGKSITPRMSFDITEETGDFKDIWWVGDLMGGGYVAIKLMNAISTGGLSLKTNDNGKGKLSVTLTGCIRMKDTDKVPMEFYYIAAEE